MPSGWLYTKLALPIGLNRISWKPNIVSTWSFGKKIALPIGLNRISWKPGVPGAVPKVPTAPYRLG